VTIDTVILHGTFFTGEHSATNSADIRCTGFLFLVQRVISSPKTIRQNRMRHAVRDVLKVDNYRGITQVQVTYKRFHRIVSELLENRSM
jgi:hypothetical protein